MKIKIFRCENMEDKYDFEKEINDFIKNKKIIDIKYQEHTSYSDYSVPTDINEGIIGGDVFGSILVLYEDNENEK